MNSLEVMALCFRLMILQSTKVVIAQVSVNEFVKEGSAVP